MITVYRVQDKEGRGPWRPGFSHRWVIEREDHDLLTPWILEHDYQDVLKKAGRSHVGCACRTIEQLRRWITGPEYQTLKAFGYRAYRIPVDRVVADSAIQCVVSRAKPFNKNCHPFPLYPA